MSSRPASGAPLSANNPLAGGAAPGLHGASEESENQPGAIFDSVTQGFAVLDREWRVTSVNSAWETLTGKTRVELLGQIIWEVFPELAGTIYETEYRRADLEETSISVEGNDLATNRWLSVTAYPSGDGGLALCARDFTDQKKFAEALLASEERFRSYFEQGLIGMAITSPTKGRVE